VEGGDLGMSSIDERVVSMKFDNAQFEHGIRSTMDALSALNKSLKLDGATKGMSEVSAMAASGLHLGHLASAVESISSKFSALGAIAFTTLQNITNQALHAGTAFAKSFTIDPIKGGLKEYETNLNSIQTIMANTGLEGQEGLDQVNHALHKLNEYSDQTIYNFAEMARNIGTFTAAGVDLETSTAAIKGIANLAAMSGSNSEQASTAMYQLSQALATGTVRLMDWNSVNNAGMGGKVFKDAIMETARAHGIAIDDIIKQEGSFRDSLQTGWLSSEILLETLNKFTGDMTDAQLKQLGYTEEQIVEIQKLGKIAQDAATKVKTMSQLFGTLREAAGSGWAKTWELIIGDFEEARTLWTGASDTLKGFIDRSAEARNKVLSDWKALGGRTVLIEAIKNAFDALMRVITPIKDAFREIFPAKTGQQLYDMTVALKNFMAGLKIGGETADKLKRTFAGFFAILGIGWEVLKAVISMIGKLFGSTKEGAGGFLDITAAIGDWLVKLHEAIKNGSALTNFFTLVGTVLKIPIQLLGVFIKLIGSLFGGFESIDTSSIDAIGDKFSLLGSIGQVIEEAWKGVIETFKSVFKVFEPLADKFQEFFSGFGEMIANAFRGTDSSELLSVINTALFGGLLVLLRKFIRDGLTLDFTGGVMGNLAQMFDTLTGSLKAMQTNLQAKALLKIAFAIGILAISVVALSLIDPARLTAALTAITVMFVQLGVALKAIEIFGTTRGAIRLAAIAAGFILLAIAIDLLAVAVRTLATLNWDELAKGLLGVTVLIGLLIAAAKGLSGSAKGLIRAGAGLILLALAIKLLASAVKDLGGLSWNDLIKGLVGVAGILVALQLYTKFAQANKGGIASGAGLILLAAGIKLLASALLDIADLSWGNLVKGLVGLAGGLALIGAAIKLIPPTSIMSAVSVLAMAASLGMIADALNKMGSMSLGEVAKSLITLAGALTIIGVALYAMQGSLPAAVSILVTAAALGMLAKALTTMGKMSWGEVAKSLILLAASLTILGIAMYAMTGALPGAAALLVVAAALRVLAPVLLAFGDMSWGEIVKGLLMLAGVLAVLGVAALVLTPVIPSLLLLGVAIALLGVGMLAAGAGLLMFSVGFIALSAAVASGTGVIIGFIKDLIGLIPYAAQQIGLGILAIARVIAKGGPEITEALVTILNSLLDAIIKALPKIGKLITLLIETMLKILVASVPKMVDAGMRIITGVLNGIAKNIGKLVTAATNMVVAFINGVRKNLPRIIQAGFDLIISFINGIADAIRRNSDQMGQAGGNLASALVEGMIRGMAGGVGAVANAARNLARSAINAAKSALGITSPSKEFEKLGKYSVAGFAKGLAGDSKSINAAYKRMTDMLRSAMKESAKDVESLTTKLHKLQNARRKDTKAIAETKAALALAKAEHAKEAHAFTQMTKHLTDEKVALTSLANKYDVVTGKLKKAQEQLAAAKKTRDDYGKAIKDQYDNLPEIDAETTLAEYEASLQKQISDTLAFARIIQKLRDMGLSDALYADLLSKGTAALPFMQQILDGGQSAVSDLNNLGGQLANAASGLGTSASKALYQAGVDAAQGLVDGLVKEQAAIQAQMDKIALAMVTAIKKALGIKSPSKMFQEVGQAAAEGMVLGLKDMSGSIARSAEDIGGTAVSSLKDTLADLSSLIPDQMDMAPVIRPVLDMTYVKRDAALLSDILIAKPVQVGSAYDMARWASTEYQAQKDLVGQTTSVAGPTDNLTFIQNNTSPKALSSAEIYRQTKNQISVAKGALIS
jgi:tape measure domain-containing protein